MAIKNFITQKWRDFHKDVKGNVLILVGLAAIPMFGIAGLALDYTSVLAAKTRLNASLDAASVAAIAKTLADKQAGLDDNTAIADGQTQGAQAFKANAGSYGADVGNTLSVVVVRNGQNVTATSSYTASVPTTFGKLFNITSWNVSNSNSSTLKMPLYIDFYMLLDVSGSMGIPSTTDEQTRLAAVNADDLNNYPTGCTFACHFTTYKACQNKQGQATTCQGYIQSRAGGVVNSICQQPGTSSCIQLRLDAIGVAISKLLATAQSTEAITGKSNQFRVGLYPFIVHTNANFQTLSTDLTGVVTTKANSLPSQLDTGNSTGVGSWDQTHMGSGGTNINNALNEMYQTVPTTHGDGSSATSTLPFVFLITDGAQDNQTMTNSNGSWSGSNHATVLTQSYCTTLKTRATLAILYVPYSVIPNPNKNFAGDEDDYANNNIPNIPPSLQSCASAGQFYTANSPADITAALQLMFNNALQMAPRLVN